MGYTLNYPPVIDSQGEQTNPTTATVMADTGALPSGIYEVLVIASATANAHFQLQHRNAANSGNSSDACVFYITANSPAEVRARYAVNKDERIRVMMDDNLTGGAAATVFVWRVA